MNTNNFQVNDLMLATKGQRFLNYFIDTLFIYLFIFVVLIIFLILNEIFGWMDFDTWIDNINSIEEFLIYSIFSIIYYSLFEGFSSKSIAKYITKTIVVMKDGSKPNFETIRIRSLCRIIPFDHFSFLGTKPIGWHDSMSKTYVVDKNLFKKHKNELNQIDEINEIGTTIY
jgi:uncharacterized RDD family membrane protein YckC